MTHRGSPQPARVLIVEDNEDAAGMLGEFLRLSGFQVTVAHEARTGLQLLLSYGADVVLSDIKMPGPSGYDFAEAVRNDPRVSDVGLIAVTAFGSPRDVERTAAAGFDVHLAKPVDPHRLIQKIQELLESRPREHSK